MSDKFFIVLDDENHSPDWREIVVGHVFRKTSTQTRTHDTLVEGTPLDSCVKRGVDRMLGSDKAWFYELHVKYI